MIHSKITLLGAVAALSSIVAAHPLTDATLENLFKRATVSPDNSCGLLYAGANNGYICDATTAGSCCSQYGYCGATSDYCGTGCQSAYGTCATGDGSSAPNVTGSTDPNLCGPTNAGSSCGAGLCCSQNGYCGNTTDYCDSGCQSTYGICDGGVATGGNGLCGPMNNGEICPTGQCCSPAGYCGTTEDYCASPACLDGYGTCDSDQTPPGASTASIPRPVLGSVPYGVDIYDCNDPGHVACTFDDGPSMYTNDLLNLLASYGVQCTFFITSNNNGKGQIDLNATYTADVQRMITDNHHVASHTWSHQNLSSLTVDGITTEMIKNEMSLRNIIGKIPTYMRPPFSECDADCHTVMGQLGYHVVYFDLDTQDYLHDDPTLIQQSKDIVHNTLSTANPANMDYLAISHDIHYQTVYNFTNYFLDQMNTYGFKAVTVGACLQDPPANWYRSATVSNVSSTSTSMSSTSMSSTSSSSSSLSSSLSSSSSSSSSATTTSSTTMSSTSSKSSTTTVSSTTSSTTKSSTSSTSSTSVSATSSTTKSSTSSASSTSMPTTSSTKTSTSSTGTSTSVSSANTLTSSTKTSSMSSTRASTSTAPTNPSCAGTQVGNYCCQPSRGFQDMGGCWESYANCMLNVGECMTSNRNGDWNKCNDYNTNNCENLLSFCEKCDWNSCDSSKYHG